jgi:hypothetical protein
MSGFEVGLQHRMKRLAQQTAEQHRQIAGLQRALDAALERGERSASRAAVERYAAALRAHFELEQSVFFPALHGLAPGRTGELDRLEQEHAAFLAELVQLGRDLGAQPLPGCREALLRHMDRMRDHERREEQLVTGVSEPGH